MLLISGQVERALDLYSRQLVDINIDTKKGVPKYLIQKVINPETGKMSTIQTDFSYSLWGTQANDYLTIIKSLPAGRFDNILRQSRSLSRYGGKILLKREPAAEKQMGSRLTCLQSESESDEGAADEEGGFEGDANPPDSEGVDAD